MKLEKIARLEPPLDLRITSQRARARARNVYENSIEAHSNRKRPHVSHDHVHVLCRYEPLQQASTMRMQLSRHDGRTRITRRQHPCLSPWGGTAVENVCSCAGKQPHKLRSFILNVN